MQNLFISEKDALPKYSGTLIFIIISVLFGLTLWGIVNFHMDNFKKADGGGEDIRCYHAIIDRIHSGEGYYQAAQKELSARYPLESVFNYRLPLLGWGIGKLPDKRIAQIVAIILSLFAVGLWINIAINNLKFWKVASGGLLLLGASIYSILPDIYVMHELWAGTLISISLLSYGKGWRGLSFATGILSLFIRELAFPYIAVMFALSLRERKYWEASIWASGITAFFIILFIHSNQVREYFTHDEIHGIQQWITFSGWKFVLATSNVHPYLITMPSWVTSIYVPLSLLGFLGWRGPMGIRLSLTVCIYVLIFLFVGQKFNAYWGLLFINLLQNTCVQIGIVAQ